MTMLDWILVGSFIAAGIIFGNIAGRVIGRLLSSPAQPDAIKDASKALSNLVMYAFVIAGLIAALGILQPDALAEIPKDLIAYLPRLLSAAIIIISASVISSFAQAALAGMLGRSSASVQRQVNLGVKVLIVGLATVLAVTQLGIDTTVINIALGAVFFGLAASFTLLVGMGGQSVASEVAATRAARRLVFEGDRVSVGEVSGVVVAVRPTAVEIRDADGSHILVPSTRFVGEPVTITRAETSTTTAD